MGTAPDMQIEENMALAYLRTTTSRNAYFSRINAADKKKFREQLALLDMGLEDRMKQPVGLLSGGQRQALTLLMATMVTPKILLLDEPTRGIDVGAKAEIYQLINNLAKQGMAIIVVSSELPEVIGISDRIVTFCEGELTGEYLQEEATQEKLLQSATK